ncbi:WxL domain-containing protein [Enterococcus sp. LJL99]
MNKKMFTATVALGSLLFVGGTQAHAEEATATHQETKTGISFYDKNKPWEGPFEGNIAFAYVPGNFNFGSNEVNTASASYAKTYAQADTSAKYLAISDDRETKGNWTVNAKLAAFTDGADVPKTLDQAVLSFNTGGVKQYAMDIAKSDQAKTPTPAIDSTNVTDFTNPDYAKLYSLGQNVSLVAGATDATKVLSYANSQNVADALVVATQISDVKLRVMDHKDVVNKSFTSTISWDLSDDVAEDPTPNPEG